MEQQSIVTTNTLEIQNLQYAHEQYDDFVDIHGPLLNVSEFKTRRGLPLNEQCAAVFYEKTMNLKDTDFIEIDRQMLQMIGFKNMFIEKKDKQGNVKLDENGKPKLEDTRKDFNNAIRCLRNMAGFIESDNFEDHQADFIIQKNAALEREAKAGAGGHNKLTIWIRKRMLEHLVIMANTSNSRMIREFFIDLKHIMTEYTMYQAVYHSKQALCIKDTQIDELLAKVDQQSAKIDTQNKKIDAQSERIGLQSEKLDMLAHIL